jgi:hypothetical protein
MAHPPTCDLPEEVKLNRLDEPGDVRRLDGGHFCEYDRIHGEDRAPPTTPDKFPRNQAPDRPAFLVVARGGSDL